MAHQRAFVRLSAIFAATMAGVFLAVGVGLASASATTSAPEPRGEVKPAKIKKWTKLSVQSPNDPSGMHNELVAVDCTGADCTAIGLWGPSQDVSKPTFTKFRGKQYRAAAAPTKVIPGAKVGDLARAVSCVGQNWCMVVGNTHKDDPADLTWSTLMKNGKWSKKSTVTPTNGAAGQAYLFGVKCTSTKFCLAVGHYFDTDANSRGLVLRWNGKTWSRILSSKFADVSLSGVDCTSNKNCVIVGSGSNGPKVYRISDGRLENVSGPTIPGNQLVSVSCVDGKWCGAAGGTVDAPLAVSINGTKYSRVGTGSNTNSMQTFSGISCSAKNRCTVATSWQDKDRFLHPAVWTWRSGTRKMTIMPGASKYVGTLNGIDCQPTRCLAVGQNYLKGDMFYQLINNAFQGPTNR